MRWLRVAFAAALALAGCGEKSAVVEGPSGPVLKVLVTTTGEIRVEGKPTTLDDLEVRFADLARKNGSVFYFREDPKGAEPHPNAMKVVNLVVAHRLPIRFATGPDFTRSADLPPGER